MSLTEGSKLSLLLIGPGYLGGTVLKALLEEGKYLITSTCRAEQQAESLRSLGCAPAVLSLDDANKIKQSVAQHDVIINTASADHWESIAAILAGIEERHRAGRHTIYLHTSGTGATLDDAQGYPGPGQGLDDGEPEHLYTSLNPGAIHRAYDKAIEDAAVAWRSSGYKSEKRQQTEVRILLPPMIFGTGTGPFRKLGNVLPNVIRAGIDAKVPIRQGEGTNVATCVQVEDCAAAYSLLLTALSTNGDPRPAFPQDLYIFLTSGLEYTWRDLCQAVGRDLYARKLVTQAETVIAERQHLIKHDLIRPKELWNGTQDFCAIGGNDHSRASKLRKLGWTATRSTMRALIDSISTDITGIVNCV